MIVVPPLVMANRKVCAWLRQDVHGIVSNYAHRNPLILLAYREYVHSVHSVHSYFYARG